MNAGELVEALKAVHPSTPIMFEVKRLEAIEAIGIEIVKLPPETDEDRETEVAILHCETA